MDFQRVGGSQSPACSATAAEKWAGSPGVTGAGGEHPWRDSSLIDLEGDFAQAICRRVSNWLVVGPVKSRGSTPRRWRQGQRDPTPSIRPHRPRRHPRAFPPLNRASGSSQPPRGRLWSIGRGQGPKVQQTPLTLPDPAGSVSPPNGHSAPQQGLDWGLPRGKRRHSRA